MNLESARLLKESSRTFAVQKAGEEGNIWAISALLDIEPNLLFEAISALLKIGPNLYMESFENYLKGEGPRNLIILDVLLRGKRPHTELIYTDLNRAYVLACKYKNDYVEAYLINIIEREYLPDLETLDPQNHVETYDTYDQERVEEIGHRLRLHSASIDQTLEACKADNFTDCSMSVKALSEEDRRNALEQAIGDGNLMAGWVLAGWASLWDESFLSTVNKAIEGADHKMLYVLLQAFIPSTNWKPTLTHPSRYGKKFNDFYADFLNNRNVHVYS